MRKILYIEANTDGTIGGSYYSLLYLIQGLDKTKYEPHVLFFQDNVLIAEFKKVTPYVYVYDFKPSVSSPVRTFKDFIKWPFHLLYDIFIPQFKIQNILNKIGPDMVHLSNGHAALHEWMLACYLRKVKIVAHDRGTRAASFRTIIFSHLLDAIIAVSDDFKNNSIKQGVKAKRICRVYNGLDINKMTKRAILSNEAWITDNSESPLVGIIGNIDRWKGQLVVLMAIIKVRKKFPGIKCLIVGPVCKGAEEYKAELDEFTAHNNLGKNIVFAGYRNDIPDILQSLDVLIHASIAPEPFGRVILEGMAYAKPIVATNSGGTIEQIVDGETGILVPMSDPDSMANAILFYLTNMERAREMGEKGRQRLIATFSIARMVEETEKVYEEIFSE